MAKAMKGATLLLLASAGRASEVETCLARDGACASAALAEPLGPVSRPAGDHVLLQMAAQPERSHHLALQQRKARGASRAPSAAMQEVLEQHNLYRCMHGVPLMEWNDGIAANAQSWATATGGQMQHSSSDQRSDVAGFWMLGENLAKGITSAGAVDLFYSEIQYTDNGRTSSFSMQTGHYTQVVWRESTSLGCATNGDLLVCQYGPTGNMQGQFDAQVNGPVRSESECRGGGGSPSPSPTPTPTPTPAQPTPSPTPTPSPSPGGCQDSATYVDPEWSGDCDQWAAWVSQGYKCQDYPSIAGALRENCPVACGFGCDASPTPSPSPTPTPTPSPSPTPTPAPTPLPPSQCKDSKSFVDSVWGGTCKDWKGWVREGYQCASYPAIKDALEANCPKACGYCA